MPPPDKSAKRALIAGFTLIEMSIVLVIIGLIVGGILVGQSLIAAAGVRATVTQIEKFNQAANTFREKYGYLPGDIPAGPAAQFGFIARGQYAGAGDGNGVIEANWGNSPASNTGLGGATGEETVFWVDLSTAGLIEGGFSTATITARPGSSAIISQYLPKAKLGNGNYIYVFSGGWGDNSDTSSNGVNYFGLNNVTSLNGGCACLFSTPGLTVNQAYSIDAKVDDGLPLTGNVLAAYINSNNWEWPFSWQIENVSPPQGPLTPATSTCFDNGGVGGRAITLTQYSLEISNGSNVNCGLTFKMQAGD
jgi:prepilin-type N-terminal cleavage/methylation domain-containing protein